MASIPIQNISDNISISEEVTINIEFPFGVVSDIISTSESVGFWTDTLHLSVSEDINISEQIYHLFNLGPIVPPNPDLDTFFDCLDNDSAGNPAVGITSITLSAQGEYVDITVQFAIASITLSATGSGVTGIMISDTDSVAEIVLSAISDGAYLVSSEENFIQWSKIGNLDFTIDNSNIAGKRPMPWAGMVYQIIRVPSGAIVYGANGITMVTPAQSAGSQGDESIPDAHTYSPQSVYETGIKGKHCVIETTSGQFCIDLNGFLCKITAEGLNVIDFSEYFSSLTSDTIMSFDKVDNLIYICDGVLGFIYNIKDNSLCSGPANITGIGYKNNNSYFMASDNITIPAFEITSDIFDFETTRSKTIHSVEIGTNVSNILSIAFDYRNSKADSFSTTPWAVVNPKGQAYLPCYGKEFRFKLRINTYELFDIDWIKIHGDINDN